MNINTKTGKVSLNCISVRPECSLMRGKHKNKQQEEEPRGAPPVTFPSPARPRDEKDIPGSGNWYEYVNVLFVCSFFWYAFFFLLFLCACFFLCFVCFFRVCVFSCSSHVFFSVLSTSTMRMMSLWLALVASCGRKLIRLKYNLTDRFYAR